MGEVLQFAPHSIDQWSLEELLERADTLGKVDVGRSGWSAQPPFRCEIQLREEFAAGHFLLFRGHGKDRREAIVTCVREVLVYVEATRRR